MWDGERLMPKNQVYCAEKLRKTLLFDGDRQIGARIENLVAVRKDGTGERPKGG